MKRGSVLFYRFRNIHVPLLYSPTTEPVSAEPSDATCCSSGFWKPYRRSFYYTPQRSGWDINRFYSHGYTGPNTSADGFHLNTADVFLKDYKSYGPREGEQALLRRTWLKLKKRSSAAGSMFEGVLQLQTTSSSRQETGGGVTPCWRHTGQTLNIGFKQNCSREQTDLKTFLQSNRFQKSATP